MMGRQTVVAGRYYPASEDELARRMAALMGAGYAGNTGLSDVYGVMVPHASLDCCGTVSGKLWGQVVVPDRVLVLGPNHTGLGARAAIASRGPFRTPGGDVHLDAALGAAIVSHCPGVEPDDLAHDEEHSIETVLPFIRARNPDARIAAVCLMTMSYRDCEALASGIVDAVRSVDGPVMIVASSDLNHGEPRNIGTRKDRMVLDRIESLDPRGLYSAVVEHHITMCGMVPTVVMLLAAKALGARYAETLGYSTSVDFDGDSSSVVGYGSAVCRSRCPVERIRHLEHETAIPGRDKPGSLHKLPDDVLRDIES